MNHIAFKKEVSGQVEEICNRVTEALKPIGFGVLTRIDFDQKIKEKLNESISPTVILGACHPKLALEVFKQSTDVALLMPCNVVVRKISDNKVIVEAARPSAMLQMIKDVQASSFIQSVDEDLKRVIESL